MVGTTIEFYDLYIFGVAAALVFPSLFFPSVDPFAGQLASFLTFALAFLARPVGAVLFGHFGDRIGRKRMLVYALILTGMSTFAMGFLPTYDAVGVLAPILLAVLRLCQGIGVGGEWSGAALIATENAPPQRRGLFGSLPQLGAPAGFLLANGFFLLLTALPSESFAAWGWRLPFLASLVLLGVGLYVRLRLVESTVFTQVAEARQTARLPLARVLARCWKQVIIGALATVGTYVLFFFMTTFTISFATAPVTPDAGQKAGLGYERTDFLGLLLIATLFFAVATPLGGLLADRVGRRRVIVTAGVGLVVFGLLFQPWFGASQSWFATLSFLVVGLTLMGFSYGPMGAFLTELFPVDVRYTGSGLVYNIGSVLGASFAPAIALTMWSEDGNLAFVGLYLTAAALVSLAALALAGDTRKRDFTASTVTAAR